MRKFLWTLIIFILILAIVVGALLLCSTISLESRISNSIQLVAAVAALLTALIALLISYPKTQKIDIEVNWEIDEDNIEDYDDSKFNQSLKDHFKEFKRPLKSKRVIFYFKNISNFDLNKPIFSFKIPQLFAHPSKSNDFLEFRSNIYNSQQELFFLDSIDYQVLSNKILPYMNKEDEIQLWVRMILDENKIKNNEITLFVNCENADGLTKKIKFSKS